MTETTSENTTNLIAKILRIIFGSEVVGVIAEFALPRLAKLWERPQGMYEVLRYEAVLELLDSNGKLARFTKRQRVRFLQDNIIAYQDQAWGDGDIFENYRCTPGNPVDIYREGHKYRVLISLREVKKRGAEEEFEIVREIRNGFLHTTEDQQVEIDHRTKQLSVSVIFPSGRLPVVVKLMEQNAQRSIQLGPERMRKLSDGRYQVKWETDNPQQFEAYVLRWEW